MTGRGGTWGLVVPVKRLSLAKTRLRPYGDAVRQDLALAFASDVVTAALGCPAVARVLVVTDDPRAAQVLAALGADVSPDTPSAGLNAALVHGAAVLGRGAPASARGDGVAALSADLPALTARDLGAALCAVPAGARAFVADAAGTGTTLLAAGAGAALRPAYGPGSRDRHAASGAAELPGAPGLRRDVDTGADLQEAVALGVGAATTRVLAGLAGLAGPAGSAGSAGPA